MAPLIQFLHFFQFSATSLHSLFHSFLLSFPRLLRRSALLPFSLRLPLPTSPLPPPLVIRDPEYAIERIFCQVPQGPQLQLHGSVGCSHLPHEPGLLWRSRPDPLQKWANARSTLASYVLCPLAGPLLWNLLLPRPFLQDGPQTSDVTFCLGLLTAQAGPNVGHLLQEGDQ